MNENITVSVIVPAYYESKNLYNLYERLAPVLVNLKLSYEIIFVDDGSKDDTWEIITQLSKQNNSIRGLKFSRNFGHQYALLAGFTTAKGKAVITMDADLQHPPELIPTLIEKWNEGNKIVNTLRTYSENISWFKKVTSNLYYKVFSYLSGEELKPDMADFKLLDRIVVDELLKMKENGFFIRGLINWMGFKNTAVKFTSGERTFGKSKYTLKKMIKFAWMGVISFSVIPLRLGIILGFLTSIIAFYQLVEALYAYFILQTTVPGWTSTTVLLTILFGVLFILIGLIGEYISRILIEIRNRPRFIISEKI